MFKEENLADVNAHYQEMVPIINLTMSSAAADNSITQQSNSNAKLNPFYNIYLRKRVIAKAKV